MLHRYLSLVNDETEARSAHRQIVIALHEGLIAKYPQLTRKPKVRLLLVEPKVARLNQ